MRESKQLGKARDHLAKAEAALLTGDGLLHLKEGLALLESEMDCDPATSTASVARNLGQTYTNRIYQRIGREIAADRNLPQPELEHLFSLLRAFDGAGFELPANSRELKIVVVRRLIDYYYEGHSAADKEEAYRRLANLSGDRHDA
jgi:hypothetical protein